MKAAIYILQTGQITKVVTMPEDVCAAQCREGQAWIAVADASDATHYIESGEVVSMPTRPSNNHVFDYTTKQWIDPRTNETQWVVVRTQRDKLLADSDWTQMPDVLLSNKTEWASYRQELRDITTQSDPFHIPWPEVPGSQLSP